MPWVLKSVGNYHNTFVLISNIVMAKRLLVTLGNENAYMKNVSEGINKTWKEEKNKNKLVKVTRDCFRRKTFSGKDKPEKKNKLPRPTRKTCKLKRNLKIV